MWWKILTRFPQCFGVVRSEEGFTESQWMWLQCQLVLDEHLLACMECDTLGTGPYCAQCGVRLSPEPRRCEACQTLGDGAYCVQCGAMLRSATEDAIDAGTYDWDAWVQSLQPFLGGLTPQEQALLRGEGMLHDRASGE
jgi:hypothetical protein